MSDDLLVTTEREHADLHKAAVIAKALREDREKQEANRVLMSQRISCLHKCGI